MGANVTHICDRSSENALSTVSVKQLDDEYLRAKEKEQLAEEAYAAAQAPATSQVETQVAASDDRRCTDAAQTNKAAKTGPPKEVRLCTNEETMQIGVNKAEEHDSLSPLTQTSPATSPKSTAYLARAGSATSLCSSCSSLPRKAALKRAESANSLVSRLTDTLTASQNKVEARGELQSMSAPLKGYFEREVEDTRKLQGHKNPHVQEARGLYTFPSGATYAGQWQGHMRHGFGVMKWPDGAKFEGQWVQNTVEGRGRFSHSIAGDSYMGEWRGNKAHGKGVYKKRDGSYFKGEWVDDVQEGAGVEYAVSGNLFEGTFARGKKEGYGVYHWPDGTMLRGCWKDDVPCGPGAYHDGDGRKIDGYWKDSLLHGTARYTWPDGHRYEGQFVEDEKEGYGVFRWPDKTRYEGYWFADVQAAFQADGNFKQGVWRDGFEVA
eukprot:TRINITY_DN112573_c0_g1_i1.p1 TRINITY_DN112573_c0_g1~~TRINITY_DN112573_c0_g1_i1.p1  ORF type:complete len:436 (-),score=77.79 TRINITY_DN112573_c0_g1_i1:162-1469(-)